MGGAVVSGRAEEAIPNVAMPGQYPYADLEGGRAPYRLAHETVNEARLYDFYQRQADYYMAKPANEVPDLLPAYPGLDGGEHGHWGKHSQNQHEDGRWNGIDHGSMLTQVFRVPDEDLVVLKGISVKLGNGVSTCFDPQTLTYRTVWSGGFISFHPFRWGTSRNAQPVGDPWYLDRNTGLETGSEGTYLGLYRHGERVLFHYQIGQTEILDTPGLTPSGAFRRTLRFAKGNASGGEIRLSAGFAGHVRLIGHAGFEGRIDTRGERHWLAVEKAEPGAMASLIYVRDPEDDVGEAPQPPAFSELIQGGAPAWPQTVTTAGTLGEVIEGSAYITDTLTVPYENPFQSIMQLSGIAFAPSGVAYVTTLAGEVWSVSGIDDDLDELVWKRFASGFNQPVGIRIDPDGMYVLDRGQITRLHDLNRDGEADYYENYANDFGGYNRSHSHTFGLHRTKDGAFHFTQRESILRTGPDRKTEVQASGVRNCMGIGGSDTFFWVGPQEGSWTPASSIIEVHPREFYGLPNRDAKMGTSIASALCYIPRGVENSVGGMVEIASDQWGPFKGTHVGLSYGSGLHYLILRDASNQRPQGAVVPLEGEFLAGAVRGAFHPQDGQLYVAGLDGWGDYSIEDGCLHRVRYHGGPVYKPSGFRVYANGLRVDFPVALESESVANHSRNIFAHAWNYEYAKRYGSPEFSARRPDSLGHDRIPVRSVALLENGRSIFVEMPAMEPVMQLHLRMHLVAADGTPFKTDLFASPMYFGEHFQHPELAPPVPGKPTAIALRVEGPQEAIPDESGEPVEGGRELLVEAAGGLLFKQTRLEARPGGALALRLKNTDVMPHNLVLVQTGEAQKVGMASFAMLNDPEAGKKHYVPDLDEVIAHTPVIEAGKEHLLHFRAPQKSGEYPYICTFPGHWQAMQGVLVVK